ncbi:MAG: acyl carrier protein [Ignavibacteriaceae bacterium]|nr:acyl carrier protein [Ignavibacteriales bacterium]
MINIITDIEENLLAYIQKECLSKNNKIVPGFEDNLFDAGIVDSAGLISFIAYIEKEYKITVPDEDLLPENFKSVSVIAKYIRSQKYN